jgi:FAD/FMN-containing dehydrogenase
MTLRDFQNHLAQAGQWLPIDPPDDGNITLGGAVATGSNGPQSFGYGPVRSFVIGMRAVLADGRKIKAGGNVVKNVAGYDLCKLFTGSYGTLGIITELTFKLRPLPAETRTIVATGSRDSLLSAGRSIAITFFPVAVELISSRLARDLAIQSKNEDILLVKFAGSSRAVVTQTAQALKVLRDQGFQCSTFDDDESIWQRLAAAPLKTENDLSWLARLRASDVPAFVNEVCALDEASHPGVQWQSGLGDGRVRVIAKCPTYHQQAVRALERLRQKAENLGGSLVVEKASADLKREFDPWGSFGSAAELMKRIKQELDPENLLSPGRISTDTREHRGRLRDMLPSR